MAVESPAATAATLGPFKVLSTLAKRAKMENELRVFISGQKYFGGLALRAINNVPGVNVVGVCCPVGDRHIGRAASILDIPAIPAGALSAETMPDGVCLGVTAHSFDYIGKKTRYKARLGWIGYHPSLLPRHRGRSAIEWALRMRDFATGGTVFWLNHGIDRGDIINQEFMFIDPAMHALPPREAARAIWQGELQDMGIRLLVEAIGQIMAGTAPRRPQDNRFSTFEPSTDVKDIYRPDALMLPAGNSELKPTQP